MDEVSAMAEEDGREGFESPEIVVDEIGRGSIGKRGRPRLDAPGAAVLSLDRRIQIRQAQKTYRLKKEATLESCKTRVAELEQRIQRLAKLFSECHDRAAQSDLHVTHPALFIHLCGMREYLAPELERLSQASTHQSPMTSTNPDNDTLQVCTKSNTIHSSSPTSIFGHQARSKSAIKNFVWAPAPERTQSLVSLVESRYSSDHMIKEKLERPPFPGLRDTERLFGSNVPITYSFHETVFYRRVHRYCLEHAYRLFTDPRSDPTVIYRIFRLVPCIRDKTKMSPYFRKLVRSGIEDTLEIPSLPFYCIGGAGTHYPHKDQCGHLAYPSNMRLPRRILGVLPIAQTSQETRSLEDAQSHLKLFGLDGEWFDCQDVQGYLEEKGVVLGRSSLFAEIHMPPLHQSTCESDNSLLDEPAIFPQDPSAVSDSSIYKDFDPRGDRAVAAGDAQIEMRVLTSSPSASRYVLDVECFLDMLLYGLVILGRAPGFKRSDVEAAFKSALRLHTLR